MKDDLYGENAKEWIDRWDEGLSIWSIEMGGIGPGYEQAIQETAVEIVRHMLTEQYDSGQWAEKEAWLKDYKKIEKHFLNNNNIPQGLSGSQFGAAVNLAVNIYHDGPAKVIADKRVIDRHILVSRSKVTQG